jgi:RNA polymerase sigma factor (sigma-70 family)
VGWIFGFRCAWAPSASNIVCTEEVPTAAPARLHRLLTSLLDTHGERLYATLLRLTLRRDVAHDLLQELFVRLARSAGLVQAADPTAYAFRAAINLALEWRRSRRECLPLEDAAMLAGREPSPLARLIQAEEVERLLDALGGLSDAAREAFVLRLMEGLDYAEIAERIGKTPHQARGLCHSAVRQLRAVMLQAPVEGSMEGDRHA